MTRLSPPGAAEATGSAQPQVTLPAGQSTPGSSGVKTEVRSSDYDSKADTCIKAFIRLLALQADAEHVVDSHAA